MFGSVGGDHERAADVLLGMSDPNYQPQHQAGPVCSLYLSRRNELTNPTNSRLKPTLMNSSQGDWYTKTSKGCNNPDGKWVDNLEPIENKGPSAIIMVNSSPKENILMRRGTSGLTKEAERTQ